jgi:hypothetical protein
MLAAQALQVNVERKHVTHRCFPWHAEAALTSNPMTVVVVSNDVVLATASACFHQHGGLGRVCALPVLLSANTLILNSLG